MLLWREEEELQELRCRHVLATAQVDIVGYLRDDIYHLLVFTELQPLLREVAKAYRLTNVELARIGLHLSQEHLDEGGFSSTIVTHDAHLLESGKVVIEVIENHLLLSSVIKSLADILALKDFAADIDGGCLQSHLAVLDALLSHLLQFVKGLLTIASLVTTSLRLTAHPVQLPAIEVLGVLNLGTKVVHSLLAFLQVVRIVATICVDGLVVQFEDDIANLVEEEAVVRHHEDGLVATVQITLQPLYHLQIEVVGWLIEHQEVRFLYQDIRQGDTFLLTTAELSHRLI